jgi:hypothetical protein
MKQTLLFSLIIGFTLPAVAQNGVAWVGEMDPTVATSPLAITTKLYMAGVTVGVGPGPGITCDFRYAPVPAFGGPWGTQASIPISYIGDAPGPFDSDPINFPSNDKYGGTISGLPPGSYEFKCRCTSIVNPDPNNPAQWTWADQSNGQLTVAALPVVLLNFKGKSVGEQVELSWSTAQERNHRAIVLERAGANLQWRKLEIFNSDSPNTESVKQYQFTDISPLHGDNHYRLRIESMDGKVEYSHIVQVGNRKNTTRIYPNPANEQLFVSDEAVERVRIYDAQGVLILEQMHTFGSPIQLTQFQSGLLRVECLDHEGNLVSVQQVIKQ